MYLMTPINPMDPYAVIDAKNSQEATLLGIKFASEYAIELLFKSHEDLFPEDDGSTKSLTVSVWATEIAATFTNDTEWGDPVRWVIGEIVNQKIVREINGTVYFLRGKDVR